MGLDFSASSEDVTAATIPLITINGMNDSGTVVGTTNSTLYGMDENASVCINYYGTMSWNPSSGTVSPVGATPTQHLIQSWSDDGWSLPANPIGTTGTPGPVIADISASPVGISDAGVIYGTMAEGYHSYGGIPVEGAGTEYAANLNNGVVLTSISNPTVEQVSCTQHPDTNFVGVLSAFTAMNAQGRAIGYTVPVGRIAHRLGD